MAASAIANMKWRLRRLASGLEWLLVVALASSAFAIGFHYFAVIPAVNRVERLRNQVERLQAAQSQSKKVTAPQDVRAQLDAFYSALAPRERMADLLYRLHKVADGQELLIDQADYRPIPDPDGRLLRYELTLPVIGSYPEIRRFLAQTERELPGLSLDGVVFQREKIEDDFLGAQLKFTLFVDMRRAGGRGSQ